MAPNDARRHVREVAGLADELSVRLRVLDESDATLEVLVEAGAVKDGADAVGIPAIDLGDIGDADVEQIAFVVMLGAARSAQDDLKAILASVKAINAGRRRDGEQGTDLDAVLAVMLTVYGIQAVHAGRSLKDDLDLMGELGEAESLRLQMAMDRMSRMMSMLSNTLKKIADTSQSIVQNLK